MSKKVVFERQIVDHVTGEVTQTLKEFKFKTNAEKFCMLNYDFDWLNKFDNGTQFKVFFLLFKNETENTGYVCVNDLLKQDIANRINLSINSVTLAIKQLVDNDCLVRVKKGIYRINPDIVYKGGSATVSKKRLIYEEIKQNKHDNN